jgi:hypothetical protein
MFINRYGTKISYTPPSKHIKGHRKAATQNSLKVADKALRLENVEKRRAALKPGFIEMFKRMRYPKGAIKEMATDATALAVVLPMARTKLARRIGRRETRWRA